MNLKTAKEITGGLTRVSKGESGKSPWYAYSLPAEECNMGQHLRGDSTKHSPCDHCYAMKGRYQMFKAIKAAQYRRLDSLDDPLWVEAMVTLISHYSPDYFRWHDSGDLQSEEHLEAIVKVAERTPSTLHWLPTRERYLVDKFLEYRDFPPNLIVRISADEVDKPAYPPNVVALTSTVHSRRGVYPKYKGSIECKSYTRGGQCGPCRACWSPKVLNVSYPLH